MNIFSLTRYRKTYKNWISVSFKVLTRKYPIVGKFRTGEVIIIYNSFQAWLASYGVNVKYDPEKDITSFSFKGQNYKFRGADKNGDLADVFGSEEFKSIGFAGKTVLDIGANIGDSTVYFAKNGAKKVIAVEPFPKSYSYLEENIALNQVENIASILNMAVSSTDGLIHLDPDADDATNLMAKDMVNGQEIKTITLMNLIKQNNLNQQAVLKIDCEGCEYEIFSNLDVNILKVFDSIWIEYHEGIKKTENVIVSKLKMANFRIEIIKKDRKSGYIIANKVNS